MDMNNSIFTVGYMRSIYFVFSVCLAITSSMLKIHYNKHANLQYDDTGGPNKPILSVDEA